MYLLCVYNMFVIKSFIVDLPKTFLTFLTIWYRI